MICRKHTLPKCVLFLCLLVPTVVATGFGIPFLKNLKNAVSAGSVGLWSRVNAEVVRCGDRRYIGSHGGIRVLKVVVYRYEFEGKTYTCSRVSPCILGRVEENALVSRYVVGDKIDVWVRKDTPAYATITREVNLWVIGLLGIGFLLPAAVFVFALFRLPGIVRQYKTIGHVECYEVKGCPRYGSMWVPDLNSCEEEKSGEN